MNDLKFVFWYISEKIKLGFQNVYYDVKLSFGNKRSISEGINEYFLIRNMTCSELKEYLRGKTE